MFKDWYGSKTLDSRLRGNDGMGIAILICFGKQVSDGLLQFTQIPFLPIPQPLFEPCPA